MSLIKYQRSYRYVRIPVSILCAVSVLPSLKSKMWLKPLGQGEYTTNNYILTISQEYPAELEFDIEQYVFTITQEELDKVAVSEENISSQEVVIENEGYFNGERCVFKPYFEGYKDAGLVIIPVKKDAFENFNDKKQQRIFKSAFKKYQKKLKKKSKWRQRPRRS